MLEVFGAQLAEWKGGWSSHVKRQLHENNFQKIERSAHTLGDDVTDTIREKTLMADLRKFSPKAIPTVAGACALFET